MEEMDVIDRFLDIFISYIDSGFGLLQGDIAYLTSTLIVIDVTLAGLFWALSDGADVMSGLLKKILYVGFFAFLLGNFSFLADTLFRSFAGLGVKAGSATLTAEDLMRPGYIASVGFEAALPLIEDIAEMLGPIAFFENFVMIAVLLIAWAVILIAFFVLAVQLFVTILEFKLTTLAGFVLVPFALWNKTAFLAERVLGNVISSGIKLMVLAVIIGIGSTLFGTITDAFSGPDDVTLADVMGAVLAAIVFLWIGISGPGIAAGLVTGAPQLGAGSLAGTAAAVGAGTLLAGAGGVSAVRGVSAGVKAGASLAGGARTAYDLGKVRSAQTGWRGIVAGAQGIASAGGAGLRGLADRPLANVRSAYRDGARQAFGTTGGSAGTGDEPPTSPAKPAWARRLTAEQRLQHAGTLAVHTLRDGDRGMSGAIPSLKNDED